MLVTYSWIKLFAAARHCCVGIATTGARVSGDTALLKYLCIVPCPKLHKYCVSAVKRARNIEGLSERQEERLPCTATRSVLSKGVVMALLAGSRAQQTWTVMST